MVREWSVDVEVNCLLYAVLLTSCAISESMINLGQAFPTSKSNFERRGKQYEALESTFD